MNRKLVFARIALASALSLGTAFAVAQTHYGDKPPAVDDIIKNLGSGKDTTPTSGTRALRPGAAVTATATTTAPKTASISMQIQFDFNSDAVSASSQTTMANLAQAMQSPELASRHFLIVGHTDGKGSAQYNQRLSERRAASVKRSLIRDGVPADRLETAGRGKSQLLNGDDPYAAENRRVEVQASG
ncbi:MULTISPECIES: OmpA family protein [unclassified Lysobacter]|uniref:OmpA family protein n=1 Tax=unclassified Lysobacter TaxID=2635362 RepID=UPI001BEAA3DB|nr:MULTISPECIES: OmpA family protein [unclassified Lysobacter]MBT2744819.1 OmpA family protein [Lysobacter sp. ISL-42]MBT2752188.1 OmpA family protein [Lysobacter sp. ISL-50]MBT2778685.1 OmpA family protein [Lysobacter sp. ISL-54]MBT2780384.1 OmpA family protein [Lysobacter sp. ISL-52]